MKKFFKILAVVLLAMIVLLGAGLGWLTLTQYSPEDVEDLTITQSGEAREFSGNRLSLLSWNTGYAGLGADADFFMDGGSSVRSTDEAGVNSNLTEILAELQAEDADFVFLQETDSCSKRTYKIDETAFYAAEWANSAYAMNYKCNYVPYPLPTIGRVTSGIMTLSDYTISSAQRLQLPLSFSWPVSVANLKRCMLVSRVPIAGSDRELVLINFHLEAYDDGAGKAAQTKMLLETLRAEYEAGNYVIAGGDFNQSFPGWEDYYPITEEDGWVPGTLETDLLPEGWQFAYDLSTPSCRSLKAPYVSGETQYYLIDGFILSPNVVPEQVQTLDLDFQVSDHNPVRLEVTLKE